MLSAAFFWPVLETDKVAHAGMFTLEGGLKYFADVREMAKQYLAACKELMMEDQEPGCLRQA